MTTVPSLTNAQLAAAMSHLTRARVLTILNDRVASPREISEEIGEALNNVAYHVKILAKLGCIEMVRTEPSRGGRVVEHFYRATERSYIDDEGWAELGEREKRVVTTMIMRMISYDVNVAIASGTFFESEDSHLSRTPILSDMEGWQEIKDILEDALLRLLAVRENVNSRSPGNDQDRFPVRVNILQYRVPGP